MADCAAPISSDRGRLLSAIEQAERVHAQVAEHIAAMRGQHSAASEDYCRIGNTAFDASQWAVELDKALTDVFSACNEADDAAYERRLARGGR